MKITKLTPKQEKELTKFYQETLKFGRSIEPINHERCESIIEKFYERIGKEKPTFLYFSSPIMCMLAYVVIKNGTIIDKKILGNDTQLYTQLRTQLLNRFAGQQWLYWQSFYKFAQKIGVTYEKSCIELMDEWIEEGKNLHWWFPYDGIVLISERPIRLNVNERGQLHDEKEKAIEYSDGWGFHYLNGVSVPEELVTTSAENLSMEFFKKEKNADIKTEFVRKYGVERMLEMGKKIDSYENYDQEEQPWWWKSQYELWDMKVLFEGIEYQPFFEDAESEYGSMAYGGS